MSLVVLVLAAAALTYPGEWSHLNTNASRWLYNRGAKKYQRKWQSKYYLNEPVGNRITQHIKTGVSSSGVSHILDLGCGTGRGTRLVAEVLSGDTQFTLVDFSPGMLGQFRRWLDKRGPELSRRTKVVELELGAWARHAEVANYGAVFLLEVGEFLPLFSEVIQRVGIVTAEGGSLVMTRPAGAWSMFFPGRGQSRAAIRNLLLSAGFDEPEFVPWRSRYELVFTRKHHSSLELWRN